MPTPSSPDAREWVRRIEDAIRDAHAGRSGLDPAVLAVPGMTSHRVKHFLNNLCRGGDVSYLEVGSWQGATVTAASCNNAGRFTAVDNFSRGGNCARSSTPTARGTRSGAVSRSSSATAGSRRPEEMAETRPA